MKKFLVTSLLFFISFGSNGKGPFFWKAEKDGRILHILGTAHLSIPLEDLQCSREISQSLNQSNLVWAEQDPNLSEEEIQVLSNVLSGEILDPLRQSFQNFNEESKAFFLEQRRILRQIFWMRNKGSKAFFPSPLQMTEAEYLEFLNDFNYSGLAKLVEKLCYIRHFDLLNNKKEEGSSIDAQIQSLARDKEIPRDYLDEIEQWANAYKFLVPTQTFSKEDVEERIKNFNKDYCSLENFKARIEDTNIKTEHALKKLILDYLSGRSSVSDYTLQQLISKLRGFGSTEDEIKKQTDSFNETVFKIRNETWLEKLVSAHQLEANKEMFVATGVDHFIGYHNVLDMLTSEGFTVKRYSAKCVAEESHQALVERLDSK